MESRVIMKRRLFDSEISQQSDTGYFSATDLQRAGNAWRLSNHLSPIQLKEFLKLEKTKEFIAELESQLNLKVKKASRGRGSHTWLHPYLFIDFALYISPKLKIEVYKWLYDELLKYRNNSGDSYKKMTGALWENAKRKDRFSESIQKTANMIRIAVGVKSWQDATEEQLKLRDRIHENIALLCDILQDNNQAIKLGIKKTLSKL